MSLSDRIVDDLMLLAYVTGAQRADPAITNVKAIEKFVEEFGHHCMECDIEALRSRLQRMKVEHIQSKKSHGKEG